MPNRVNGCGTWYYGKQDLSEREGACPHCGRVVRLSSFSTRQWISILFVPVIPLQRKRILDQCPLCTVHRAVSLKSYEVSKEALYKQIREQTSQNPKDPQAAMEQLRIYNQFQDWPALDLCDWKSLARS